MFSGLSDDFKKGAFVTLGVVVALIVIGVLLGALKR